MIFGKRDVNAACRTLSNYRTLQTGAYDGIAAKKAKTVELYPGETQFYSQNKHSLAVLKQNEQWIQVFNIRLNF